MTTTWREWENIFGQMEDVTKESTKMIRNMAMVFIHGQTTESIKVGGSEVNNTVLVCISYQVKK